MNASFIHEKFFALELWLELQVLSWLTLTRVENAFLLNKISISLSVLFLPAN